MPRLLNALGFILFVLGAIVFGYFLYLLIAGVIGWNPFEGRRPAAGLSTLVQIGLVSLVLFVGGWLLAMAAVRAEWKREVGVA